MKKLILLSLILFTALSCNDDDSSEMLNTDKSSQNLISGSPWVFNRFEVTEILNKETSLSIQEIENAETNLRKGLTITFYKNGTGLYSFPNLKHPNFEWRVNQDTLITTSLSEQNILEDSYSKFSISKKQFIVHGYSEMMDDSLGIEIGYNGKWIYE